jgi:hypothetical protein
MARVRPDHLKRARRNCDTLPRMPGVDYYPIISGAVLKLPSNTREARLELYEHARKTLTAQPMPAAEIKRELRALEFAIRAVEKSPRQISGARGSMAWLVVSMFFPILWVMDATSMSFYWVVRPWSRRLLPKNKSRRMGSEND